MTVLFRKTCISFEMSGLIDIFIFSPCALMGAGFFILGFWILKLSSIFGIIQLSLYMVGRYFEWSPYCWNKLLYAMENRPFIFLIPIMVDKFRTICSQFAVAVAAHEADGCHSWLFFLLL